MADVEKMRRRLEKARDTMLDFAKSDTVWKQAFADAVLSLLSERTSITAKDIEERLTSRIGRPIKITGAEMDVEFSRAASEAAIKHLSDAVRIMEGNGKNDG